MAEKRHLEAVGTVAYSKLPRLEAAPSHVLTAGLCRSSVLPGHPSDGHYSYQGTYFGYPLQCHEPPELSAHWSPANPYVSCTDGSISQQLRPEKAHCMLYRQESEGLGMWVPNPSYEKRKDCLVGETLAAQEKWANYSGHMEFIQQGWIQGFPMPHSSRLSTGCPPLAAPKPVYRNHVYCTDASCSPKGSLASGRPVENPLKQPASLEWTLPPSGHLGKASCGSTMAKKTPDAESGFRLLHQSWKDAAAAPSIFSPYHKTFENLQVAPSASVADASYAAGCNNQKSFPEECAGSPCGKVWSKLPPPASPLAAPSALIYQERSAACYPLPSYPLTSHEQLVLYQQSVAQPEKPKDLFALPACKNFNFAAGENPQLVPKTCFPPAPRSCYPGHLESYIYQALDSPPVVSPSLKTFREHGSPEHSRSKISCEQRNPISACPVTEKASWGSSLPGREGVRGWPGAKGVAKPTSESFWGAPPQPCIFQPGHPVEKLPSCIDGYKQTREAIYGAGAVQQEKGHVREEGSWDTEKQSGLSSEDKKKDASKTLQSGVCVVIPDSPVTSHDSCLKGDSLRPQFSESSDPSAQHPLQSPIKEPRGLKQMETPPPSSSPPMPVIHNVFSLAPYREYLEGSTDSLHLPSSKGCPADKPSPKRSWQNAEETTSPRPPSARSSTMPGLLPDRGKDKLPNAVADGGSKDPSSSCIVTERESEGYAGFCEIYQGCPNTPATSRLDAAGCVSELAKDDHVLDLSLKTEGLVDAPHAQRPAGKTEALERENGKRDGESVKEGPAKGQETMQDTASPALQPPPKNSSEEKSNFQSSVAFLYKKFKILKSHAAGSASVRPQNFLLFQSSLEIAALSNNFSLQQDVEQAATQANRLPVQQSSQQVAAVQQSCQQAATQHNSVPVQQSSQQVVAVQQSCQPVATQQNSLPVQQSSQQVAAVQQRCQQVATQHNSLPVQPSFQQVAAVQQHCQQVATQHNSLPVQPSFQQVVAVQLSCQQAVTQQNSLPVQGSSQQVATQQNTLLIQQSCQRVVTRQNSLPIQQSFQHMMTRRNSLPAPPVAHEKSAKPNTQRFSRRCLTQPAACKQPPAAPAGSPALGEALLPPSHESPAQQASPKQHFTTLHASVCAAISDLVSASPPERLREWLEKAEPEAERKREAASSAKAKSGLKTPEAPKPSKGKWVWLASENAARLLGQLQTQLETFVFLRECPFPHVTRAGTIFVPIHMVKEKLFGHLPGPSIDHVLQNHKVELRPTTLSEEKLLRERDLKTCPSRLLKLLALKQLPDLYPDLLDLHWRHCAQETLSEPAEEIWRRKLKAARAEGSEAAQVSRCLQSAIPELSPRRKHKEGTKCESAPPGEAPGPPSKILHLMDTPKAQGLSSFSTRKAVSTPTKGPPQEDAASVAARPKRFPLRSGAKRQLPPARRLSGALQLRVTDRVTRSTPESVVCIKFRAALQKRWGHPVLTGKKQKRLASLLWRSFQRQRTGAKHAPRCCGYPELVGKQIRHLYEEKDRFTSSTKTH